LSVRRGGWRILAGWALAVAASRAAQAEQGGVNPAEALELPTVEVIGTTPLPGLGTPIQDVPANVQVYTSGEMGQQQAALSEYLTQAAGSVSANAAQGNPFQPDVGFRGFTASPLLGTPQGLSVFQDGVRINEPFGDIVNWDLIPQSAISSVQLIPGSNPAFGLNTLGGALAVYTKSGAAYPGGGLEFSAGSFGRRTAQFEWGGARGPVDAFVTGNYFDDRGWAQHNPSLVRQFFGKLGWQDARTDLDAALTAVDNSLQGTQTLPLSFLDDIRQPYTWPDRNDNRLMLFTLKGSHFLEPFALLGGNAYYRHYRNTSFNSNVNSDYGQTDPATGLPDLVQATNDASSIDADSYGGGLQLTLTASGRWKNQFTLGASGDLGDARFEQLSQDAAFGADRFTIGSGAFAPVTDADTSSRYLGVYAADVLHLTPLISVSAAGRYNRARVEVSDRTGTAPQLNGVHVFTRFNPGLGINFNPRPRLTLYAGYSEGMRAPTAIELTCADPSAPCKLPNDFVSDPPLAAVVARTAEVGVRGGGEGWQWSAAAFQSRLSNDIEFVSSVAGASNAGYFANVGATRRTGMELSAAKQWGALAVSARYSLIDATFRSTFSESSPDNSSADAAGTILVRPGEQLPGIPGQTLKLRCDYTVGARWAASLSVLASSGVYARGDENNADRNGRLPGYALVSLYARYQLSGPWQLFARVNNLFDTRYYDFGILAEDFFTAPGHSFGPSAGVEPRAEQFRGPGAPRGVWLGARYAFGGTGAAAGAD
jgi:outer membrane receptor protein involved in Fe transport